MVPFDFVKFIINCFSLSFIYACYAFDYYARLTSGTSCISVSLNPSLILLSNRELTGQLYISQALINETLHTF